MYIDNYGGNEKCISVVILNWLRPDNIKHLILPELSESPLIGEIIISHGREDTQFRCYSNKISIRHRDDVYNNKKYGLALRFHAAAEAQYPIIVFIDDDQIVYPVTLLNMIRVYQQNFPCLVGRDGRMVNKDLTYNSLPLGKDKLSAPIALTSLLLVSKELCFKFLDRMTPIIEYVSTNSNPLWNGEDIFISILSLIDYQKWPIIVNNHKYFPVKKLRRPEDLLVAISGLKTHIPYRSVLIKNICIAFKIHPYLLQVDPADRRPKFK